MRYFYLPTMLKITAVLTTKDMNKLFWAFVCSTWVFVAHGQQITISDELPIRTDLSYDIIGELGGHVLLFREESSRYSVQAFDPNMRSSWEKDIELDKRLVYKLGLTAADSNTFVLFYFYRERGSTFVKAARYDASANLRDSVLLTDLGFLFTTPEFEFVVSEDKSKTLLLYPEREGVFRALAFDNPSMKVLWDVRFQDMDYNEVDDELHLLMDNQGGMHVVMEKDHFHSRRDRHRYELFRFSPGEADVKRYTIPIREKTTYDIAFAYDNLNRRLCGGGYYAEKNVERAEGYLALFVPEDANQARLQFYPFDEDLIERVAGKEMRSNNPSLEEIEVRDLVLRRDGGLLIIGEETKNYYRRMTTVNRSMAFDNANRNIVDYFYDDVFVIAVHPDAKPHWSCVLHKKQYSQDDDGAYSSYFLFKTPAYLRLVFNDEVKLENTVSEYVLRGTGDYDRNSILSTEGLELRIRFRDAVQTSPQRILVPSERRGKLRIARIDLL